MSKTGIIGLTGGIASGKSTISELFAQKNVPIIDADTIAREVVQKESEGLNGIVSHFGHSILLPSGELNRTTLRTIIFEDPSERLWLNNFIHPIIQKRTDELMRTISSEYLIWVVPLLIENGLYKKVERTLVIDLPVELQLSRLIEREKIDSQLAEKMIQAQISRKERLKYADDIILNIGDKSELTRKVNQLHEFYLTYFKNKN